MNFRRLGGAAGTILVLVALTACTPSTDGPLSAPAPHGYAIGVAVGAEFTDAFDVLYLATGADAVVEKVELVDTDPQVEFLGAQFAGKDRAGGTVFQSAPGWPATDARLGTVADAETATLEHRTNQYDLGYELLIGLRATEPGTFHRGGYRITYSVEGATFVVEADADITICAAETAPATCEAPTS